MRLTTGPLREIFLDLLRRLDEFLTTQFAAEDPADSDASSGDFVMV